MISLCSFILFMYQFGIFYPYFFSGNPGDSADYEVQVPRDSSVAATADDQDSATVSEWK